MEDYEKKYKDALAIVKSYYGQAHAKEAIKALESAFPELKADKSKRVKEDIKYILANTDLSKVSSSFSDMLELIDNTDNQEDKAELLDGEDYGIDGLYHAIRILEKTLGEVEGYQSDDGILEHKIAIDSVKELYSKKPKWSSEDADNLEEITMFCDLLAGGEKYKLTNEQLKSISKTLKAIKKGTVTPTSQEQSEEDIARSWSIQDAKDGDVLVLNDEVFIYAHRKQMYSIAVAHCFVDSAGGFYTDGEFGYTEKGNSIHPATKEQHDALMKAMADAGYTFDFDKKKLKKIEQKSAEQNVDNRKLLDIVIEELSKYRGNEAYKAAPWALDSTGVQYPLYFAELGVKWQKEQKTAWSEGDENVTDIILSQLRSDNFSGVLSKTLLKVAESWLKNLKDRVQLQPQPKQEWSEEDENRMDNLCHFLEEYGEQYYGGLTLKGIINWVKSLRYQNAWISVDEEVHVKEPVLAQKKDKSDPFGGFVVCHDHTLTPNVYERYMILSNIVSQNA